jgi:ribosome biogenesis GTPase A
MKKTSPRSGNSSGGRGKPSAGKRSTKESSGRNSDAEAKAAQTARSAGVGRRPSKFASASAAAPGAAKVVRNKPKPASTPFQRLTEIVKWVDLVIEVLDGRLPETTRHPASRDIFGKKPRVIIYSKSDLSDRDKLRAFVKSVEAQISASANANAGSDLDLETDLDSATEIDSKGSGQAPRYPEKRLILDLKSMAHKNTFIEAAIAVTASKREALARKGLLQRPMRACVVGIPNVGKSSLINWFVGRKKAKTGDSPGVTRGTQWIRVHPQLEMLDTPGILPANLFNAEERQRLALLNLLPAEGYDNVEIAKFGLMLMKKYYPKRLETYLEGLSQIEDGLDYIAEKKHYLGNGGRLDHYRAATIFLRDLRAGKLGEVTFDNLSE